MAASPNITCHKNCLQLPFGTGKKTPLENNSSIGIHNPIIF